MTAATDKRQSWWREFLRPNWVLLALFVVVFSYFAFTVLAPWQLGKDDQIVARNQQIEAAYDADPVPIYSAVDDRGAAKDGKEWTRVTLTGHYLADKEVLLRLRPVDSGPAYQSLVPFQTDDGSTFLVNRGWLPAGEANAVPDIPRAPQETTTIEGLVRKGEPKHESAPIDREGYTQVYSMNPEQVSELTDTKLGADYIQLSADKPGVLHPIPIPQIDRGNHLSYGYQWIAFGIMAPLGFGYLAWSEVRQRRSSTATRSATARDYAVSADTASGDAASSDAASHAPETTPGAPQRAAASPARRRHARYGGAKPDHYAKLRAQRNERF